VILSLAQDRLLRLASYRREWGQHGGVQVMRLSDGERRTAQALVNGLLAVSVDGRLYSTRKGEVQIELENDRIARQVRRARKR
jgi:hypothetical protein